LRTVPGVGLITAFVLYVELVDIKRFKGLDKIQAYIGFVLSTSSSGEKEHVNGITNRHNKLLRNIIIESAWIAVRKDPALTSAFNQLTKRLTKQRAIVRIAKRLVNRIRWVWLHQKEYVPALVECL
jgi:transposase